MLWKALFALKNSRYKGLKLQKFLRICVKSFVNIHPVDDKIFYIILKIYVVFSWIVELCLITFVKKEFIESNLYSAIVNFNFLKLFKVFCVFCHIFKQKVPTRLTKCVRKKKKIESLNWNSKHFERYFQWTLNYLFFLFLLENQIQSNSVITNSLGPTKIVRYSRDSL